MKTLLIAYCLDDDGDEAKLRATLDGLKLGTYAATDDINDRTLEYLLWNASPVDYQRYVRRDVELPGRD